LSIDEFYNKLESIPTDLKNLLAENKLSINWLYNNTYVWKKSIPTICKY